MTGTVAASEAVEADLSASSIYWEGTGPTGWALIVPGHGHDPEALEAVGHREWGDEVGVQTSEEWLSFHRRIKWCDRIGWGCDMAGEWHSHWEPVRANPAAEDAKWTLIRPASPAGSD